MNVVFVTSFGSEYYERVAQYTLPLLIKATKHYQLFAYYENEFHLTANISPQHALYFNLFHCSNELVKFLMQTKGDKLKEGFLYDDKQAAVWHPKQIEAGYNYRLNAFLFCRKWFALQHALHYLQKLYEEFVIVWMDADILMYDYLTNFERHIRDAFHGEQQIAYLARDDSHSECGFMIFKSGSMAHDVISRVCEMYVTHNVFNEREWHDSYIFDVVRRSYKQKYFARLAESTYTEDVFSKCFLAGYASHLKGRLKKDVQELIQNEQCYRAVEKTT